MDLAGGAGVRVLHLDAGIRLERLASLGQLRALSRSSFLGTRSDFFGDSNERANQRYWV